VVAEKTPTAIDQETINQETIGQDAREIRAGFLGPAGSRWFLHQNG
jgi:hypothetical protein